MSRKSKAAKILDVIKGQDGAEAPAPQKGETPWWAKMTLREFKDVLAKFELKDMPELLVLLATIRQAVREVTLRQYVEDLSLDEQKIAGRRAPMYRGCVEAVLTRIHSFDHPNKALET